MISLTTRIQTLRPLACVVHVVGNKRHQLRFISTSTGTKNSDHMTKANKKIGGGHLVLKQKMEKTARILPTLQNYSGPNAGHATVSKDEIPDFMAVFPDFARDITNVAKKYKCNDAAKWLSKALQYNLPGGKKTRGIFTVLTYKNLVKDDELTPENIRLSQYLGWCVEMLQCIILIADDIMDQSITRRGQPCWYKVEEVGLVAVNDVLMLENSIYMILKQHFSYLDCYADLFELFHEVLFITTCGQSLDLLNSNKNVTNFTMEYYKSIAINKTAFYSFSLPFFLAMHLAGFKDAETFRQSKTILLEIGHFFQIQDDFLDCFGNPKVTGKVGTDIQDNKCSWLSVVCMQCANEEQKNIMAECYGKNDPAKVERVKELYKELGLPKTYEIYEEESYNTIKLHIQQISRDVPHEIFLEILNKLYQRNS